MADKEIKVKVKADTDTTKLNALEHEMDKLKNEKIQLKIETKTKELEKAESELQHLKSQLSAIESVPAHIRANVEDDGVKALKSEIASMEHKVATLEVDVEMAELEAVKSEIKVIESDPINVALDTSNAMESIENIKDGFSSIRQSAGELKGLFSEVMEGAGQREMNSTFLEMNLGAEKATKGLNDINSAVQQLPGDDTALQGLLSNALVKNSELTRDNLLAIGSTATDYFSAMSFYGKSSIEAQQDMTNYILSGNTAELERSPILQSHIDKLKEAETPMERQKALQEALTEEGWAGISTQDTYNNKLETFNGMLQRGKDNFGLMFQEASKGAMDFLINLDEASGGLVGMGFAVGEFVAPLTEGIMGLGQMATGVKAIKDLGFVQYLKDLELASKLSSVATWLQNTALWGMIAPILANPITWLVIALIALAVALVWAYNNVDWFREMVDNAWASIQEFASVLWNNLVSAFNYVTGVISNFTNSIGLNSQNWVQAILGFILFLPTLPARLGVYLANSIAHVLGFKGNIISYLHNAGMNAVNNFINYIQQIPSKLGAELSSALNKVNEWASTLPQKFWDAGVNAVKNFLSALGIASPGTMQRMLVWEISEMGNRVPTESKNLLTNIGNLGDDIVDEFGNPKLDMSFETGNTDIIKSNKLLDLTGGSGGDTIINVYGDVDSEKRVNEIIEAVRRELNWNNATAGRTV